MYIFLVFTNFFKSMNKQWKKDPQNNDLYWKKPLQNFWIKKFIRKIKNGDSRKTKKNDKWNRKRTTKIRNSKRRKTELDSRKRKIYKNLKKKGNIKSKWANRYKKNNHFFK